MDEFFPNKFGGFFGEKAKDSHILIGVVAIQASDQRRCTSLGLA